VIHSLKKFAFGLSLISLTMAHAAPERCVVSGKGDTCIRAFENAKNTIGRRCEIVEPRCLGRMADGPGGTVEMASYRLEEVLSEIKTEASCQVEVAYAKTCKRLAH
jgi:hypothetical protein